jgi:Ran GTPase-activating protein (RanGAP) involved in mRNA processing and transport
MSKSAQNRKLKIPNLNFGTRSAFIISEIIKKNEFFSIDLSKNNFSESIIPILESILYNSTCVHLNIANNFLSP